jgi:hypothetical protein
MSWDALIMHFGDAKLIEDVPSGFTPPPVATSTELRALLLRLYPDGEHEPDRSHLQGDDYWLELNHGCHTGVDGTVSCVGVRSNAGSGAIQQLKRLCAALDAQLYDIQTGEITDFSTATGNIQGSMQRFAEWRDRVIGESRPP